MKGHWTSLWGLCAVVSACLVREVHGLFAEEAGELDFVVATTGHGAVQTATPYYGKKKLLITSDGSFDEFGVSCYLAARSLDDGKLVWRRNVCTEGSAGPGYRVASSMGATATVNRAGILQMWDTTTGTLLWDKEIAMAEPYIWFPDKADGKEVAVGEKGSNTLTFFTRSGLPSDSSSGNAFSSKPESTSSADKIDAGCQETKDTLSFSKAEGLVASFESAFHLEAEDAVNVLLLIECEAGKSSFFISTERGTSLLLQVSTSSSEVKWSVEEGLGSVDAAVLIDASSSVEDVDLGEGGKLLSFPSRIQSQVRGILNMFAVRSAHLGREHFFGFVKVAVLLSNRSNRLYGMDTASDEKRASLRWVIDLPYATWHKIVRGSANTISSAHGIGGGTHARDILVVSYSEDNGGIYWKCLDSTTGSESGSAFVKLTSPVSQVIPMASHGACRQSAALILQDKSVVFLPEDPMSLKESLDLLRSSPNGFYSHIVNAEEGIMESLLIQPEEDSASILPVGKTSFPEEKVVKIAYPNREETIQSPSSALGDQSLLLKYINPHLLVVVTTSDVSSDPYNSLMKKNKEQKRKPAGVTQDNDGEQASTELEESPNLFVNVVDSVSGRVIHRASHKRAVPDTCAVVISENWIIYTFMNERTRRTEIGVLSLYEGMVDSKGLTAFSSPERSATFSSIDAKEAKPVVLAKTYSMVKAVSAIGVSSTGGGISGRRLLVATLSGQILAIDRKMIETRRPLSQLKDTEKKEGLRQYDEHIPLISLMSLSHSTNVEGVKGIVSCPSDLESQSLLLAFGGADIFFARTSPSRGFDLLPDSFSRVLLSIVVGALVVILLLIQMRVSKKIRDQGWV